MTRSLPTGVLWLVPLLAVAAQPGQATPLESPLPDVGYSVLRMLGGLALVLALFAGGVWFFRNWQRLLAASSGRPAQLHILETRSLGHRHALFVVAYQQQRLLVAVSPTGVTLLSQLPDAPNVPAETTPAPASFGQALRQILQHKP